MAADDAAGLAQRLRRLFSKSVLGAVQLLHQETRCFVCCDYFCNPHQCQNGHTFCKQCLDHAMQVTATCPECRNPITRRDIKPNRKLDTITLEARPLLTSEYLDDFRVLAAALGSCSGDALEAAAGTLAGERRTGSAAPLRNAAPRLRRSVSASDMSTSPGRSKRPRNESPAKASLAVVARRDAPGDHDDDEDDEDSASDDENDGDAAGRPQRVVRIATTQLSDHAATLVSRLASRGDVGGVRVSQIANLFSGSEGGTLHIPTHIVVGDAGLCPPPPGAGLAASRMRRVARAESTSTAGTEASVAVVAATGPRLWARRRTPKYLMGLAAGAWVVSEAWVHACVAAGRVVDETPFELGGDVKSEGAPAQNRRRAQVQPAASAGGPSLPTTAEGADAPPRKQSSSSTARAGSPAPKVGGLFEGCVVVAPSLGDRAERHTYFIARAAGAEAVFTTASLADAVVTAAKQSLRLRILVPVPTGWQADQARAVVTAAMALGVRDADAVRCHWVFESLSQASVQPASQFSLLKEASAASFSRLERWPPVAWSESRSCGWIHPSRTEAAAAELRAALNEVSSQRQSESSTRASRKSAEQVQAKAVVAVVTAALGRLKVALGPHSAAAPASLAAAAGAPAAVPA